MDTSYPDTILLADDHGSMRNLLAGSLRKLGFASIVTVSNGEDAIDAFKKNPFRIVILDIEMPKVDGLRVAQEIRQIDEHAFIVMVSNHNSAELIDKAIEIGVNDFIVKPFSTKRLVQSVDKYRQAAK